MGTFYLLLIMDSLLGKAFLFVRYSKLQKRTVRIKLHADFNNLPVDMFSELGWLSVSQRTKYNKTV